MDSGGHGAAQLSEAERRRKAKNLRNKNRFVQCSAVGICEHCLTARRALVQPGRAGKRPASGGGGLRGATALKFLSPAAAKPRMSRLRAKALPPRSPELTHLLARSRASIRGSGGIPSGGPSLRWRRWWANPSSRFASCAVGTEHHSDTRQCSSPARLCGTPHTAGEYGRLVHETVLSWCSSAAATRPSSSRPRVS